MKYKIHVKLAVANDQASDGSWLPITEDYDFPTLPDALRAAAKGCPASIKGLPIIGLTVEAVDELQNV